MATRTEPTAAFEEAVNLGKVNTGGDESGPSLSPDALSLYFSSGRPGGSDGDDIWVATRPDLQSPFQAPTNLTELDDPNSEVGAKLSADRTEIVFTSNRSGQWTLWRATRDCL